MSDYLVIENLLIKKISNKDLRDSLAQIRKSAQAIWSTEAPRIIQGFTDHGFGHSLRLIYYASKLLNANKGTALSDEEMYLMIAGIYLHDIGMQCDVVKFPAIKEKAIELGAKFNIEFTSLNANQYSFEEQIEIRNNHHFLSAAWIDFAFHAPETTLGKSIQSVPDDLLMDLIDICKYHSKLNIIKCPLQFEIFPQGRKQLIAALVRFSDELDVAKSRVSIETVMIFSLEAENAYYWWLHHLTNIDISDNILILNVRLSPEDYISYGAFVKETYIDNFELKNKPILEILKNNHIPITLSAESKVISYDYAKMLPPEIIKVIQEMQNKEEVKTNISIPEVKQILNIQLKDFPKPKPYFVGRTEELKILKKAFIEHPFIFIEGSGGIGKTQFVAKFIEDINIENKVVWYECIPTSQPDDVIKGAGFEELLKGKEKTEREKFSAFKDKIEENNLFIFLDNYQEVENIPAFKVLLNFFNDYLRKGHLIILGRDNIVTPQLQPKRITIKGLEKKDSLLHAQKLIEHSYKSRVKTSTEDLTILCNSLEGYPLAIDLAIYLLSLNVSVENILIAAVKEAQSDNNVEKISERLLNEIFIRPDASEEEKDFLKLFSIFRGKVLTKEALSVIPKNIFDSASHKLINRNLLEINNDCIELHPLIREFCYNELENKKEVHYKATKYIVEKRNSKLNSELEEKIFYHMSCSDQWQNISDTIIKYGRDFILQGYLDRLQQMISIVKQNNIFKPLFDIFEGDIAEIKGNWDKALNLFGKAKQSSDIKISIEGMLSYGGILFRKGNVKEAQTYFEDVIKITDNDIHLKWRAIALNNLGTTHHFYGNLKEALILCYEALQIRQKIDEKETISNSLFEIGSIKDDLGFKNDALELYNRGLFISTENGDKSSIAGGLNNIGKIKDDLGLNKEALELYEESLNICEQIGDKSGISVRLNNIGYIKNKLGFNIEALELYGRSLIISEEIGEKEGIAISLNNLGRTKDDLGFRNEALELFDRSMRISEETGNKLGVAGCLNNIGSIKLHNGFNKEAFELFERSLCIYEEIGHKLNIAHCLHNIGSSLFEYDIELEKACLYLLKSLALYKQIEQPELKNPLKYLLNLRKKIGNKKFKEIVIKALQNIDDELKPFINIDEILGEPIKVEKKQGRNDPCNCGSGKKYKQCCGKFIA